jgi:hypothetical protein
MIRGSTWFCVIGIGLSACEADITIEGEGGDAAEGGATTSAGGDDQGGGGASTLSGFGGHEPSQLEAACKGYCEQAAPKGCPEEPGCEASCLSLASVGCTELLAEFLTCAGPLLGPECVVGYPDNAFGSKCIDAEERLASCVFDESSCTQIGSEQLADGSCRGTSSCSGDERMVSCDETGHCLCFQGGFLAGTCTSIMSGIELCTPQRSCCTQCF